MSRASSALIQPLLLPLFRDRRFADVEISLSLATNGPRKSVNDENMMRDTKETAKHRYGEKMFAQIWLACWLRTSLENSFQVAQATRLCRPATRRKER